MSLIIILISKDQYMYFWSTVSTKFCHHDDILLVNIWTSSQFNLWKVLFENNVSENLNPGQKFPNQDKALSWVMAWFLISIFQLQQDNQLFMKETCEIGLLLCRWHETNTDDRSKKILSTLYRRIIQTYPMMHHFSSSTFDWFEWWHWIP